MEYQFIVNPKTNRKCSVDTRLGKKIINNYLNQTGGGLFGPSDSKCKVRIENDINNNDFKIGKKHPCNSYCKKQIKRVDEDSEEYIENYPTSCDDLIMHEKSLRRLNAEIDHEELLNRSRRRR